MKKTTVKKESPWNLMNGWLHNSNMKLEPPEQCIKEISCRSLLFSFSKLSTLTIWLNENFNDLYTLSLLDDRKSQGYTGAQDYKFRREFFKFIRELINTKKIDKYDNCYIPIKKVESYKQIREKLPHLKNYEVELLLLKIEDDEEKEGFLEFLGMNPKEKFKKTTKKEKEEFNKIEKKTEKEENISFNKWKENFK